jgi:hypothetical protein
MELTAGSVASCNSIPDEAVKLMGKQRISKWMILLLGPVDCLLKARKYGVVHAYWR